MFHNEPGVYELYKADTSAISFYVRYPMELGFGAFALTSKRNPKEDLYQFFFGPTYKFVDVSVPAQDGTKVFDLTEPIGSVFREFWLTWYSDVICMGVDRESEPILTYAHHNIKINNIGYIKFYTKSARWSVDWHFEAASPVMLKPLKEVKFEDGQLKWVTLQRNVNMELPKDALIGGFENEILYIARAKIMLSVCPGKYLNSKGRAYLPWGGRAHETGDAQVLTGYNAIWVKTRANYIPENAFVAGFSERHRESLYIGRAMFEGHLLVGKVHGFYSACYLPYKNKEVEVYHFEILCTPDVDARGVYSRGQEKRDRLLPREIAIQRHLHLPPLHI